MFSEHLLSPRTRSSLAQHGATTHIDNENGWPLSPPLLSHLTRRRSSLPHTQPSPAAYVCTYRRCGRTFTDATERQEHVHTHHKNKKRKTDRENTSNSLTLSTPASHTEAKSQDFSREQKAAAAEEVAEEDDASPASPPVYVYRPRFSARSTDDGASPKTLANRIRSRERYRQKMLAQRQKHNNHNEMNGDGYESPSLHDNDDDDDTPKRRRSRNGDKRNRARSRPRRRRVSASMSPSSSSTSAFDRSSSDSLSSAASESDSGSSSSHASFDSSASASSSASLSSAGSDSNSSHSSDNDEDATQESRADRAQRRSGLTGKRPRSLPNAEPVRRRRKRAALRKRDSMDDENNDSAEKPRRRQYPSISQPTTAPAGFRYLLHLRHPPDTPPSDYRCCLCKSGSRAALGALLRCDGPCALAFHQGCIGMLDVPTGEWYCSDECMKGETKDDVVYIRVVRRWKKRYDRQIQKQPQQTQASLTQYHKHQQQQRQMNTGKNAAGRSRRKPTTTSHTAALQGSIPPPLMPTSLVNHFIVFPHSSYSTHAQVSAVPTGSEWREPFASRFGLPKPKPVRHYKPLSLTAAGNMTPAPLQMQSKENSAGPLPFLTKQGTPSFSINGTLYNTRATNTSQLLQGTLTYPSSASFAYELHKQPTRAVKGSASSRSLRNNYTAQRSAAYLLSLRVPNHDPNYANCCVCEDGDSTEDNPIILCDGPCYYAYHRYCVGLTAVPSEDDVWCCGDVCRNAKAKGLSLSEEFVVKMVQQRRDDYAERGPYDERSAEMSAELKDIFSTLDQQYFCPLTLARVWNKGKWRLQALELDTMIDMFNLISEVGEIGVRMEQEQEQEEGNHSQQPTQTSQSSEQQQDDIVPSSQPSRHQGEEEKMDEDKLSLQTVEMDESPASLDAARNTQESPTADQSEESAVRQPVPLEEHQEQQRAENDTTNNADADLSISASATPLQQSETALSSAPPATETDAASGTGSSTLADASITEEAPPDAEAIIDSSENRENEAQSMSSPAATASADTVPMSPPSTKSSAAVHLSEYDRLLAAYYAQVLVNNQTKSHLLRCLFNHPTMHPGTLSTLAARQQAEQLEVTTYVEYEEKLDVGTKKDRARRAQHAFVNYCTCSRCYNAHLNTATPLPIVSEPEVHTSHNHYYGKDESVQEDNDAVGGLLNAQNSEDMDVEADMEEDEAPVMEPTASALLHPNSLSVSPVPPSVSTPVNVSALVRYVETQIDHHARLLSWARRSSGSPELSVLLHAGQNGRTTRGQLKTTKAKRNGFIKREGEERSDAEDSQLPHRHHSSRKRALVLEEPVLQVSPSPPPDATPEQLAEWKRQQRQLNLLQTWTWDKTYRETKDVVADALQPSDDDLADEETNQPTPSRSPRKKRNARSTSVASPATAPRAPRMIPLRMTLNGRIIFRLGLIPLIPLPNFKKKGKNERRTSSNAATAVDPFAFDSEPPLTIRIKKSLLLSIKAGQTAGAATADPGDIAADVVYNSILRIRNPRRRLPSSPSSSSQMPGTLAEEESLRIGGERKKDRHWLKRAKKQKRKEKLTVPHVPRLVVVSLSCDADGMVSVQIEPTVPKVSKGYALVPLAVEDTAAAAVTAATGGEASIPAADSSEPHSLRPRLRPRLTAPADTTAAPAITAKRKKTYTDEEVRDYFLHDDFCTLCQCVGDLMVCDGKLGNSPCHRNYHAACLKLKRIPEGDWLCPYHFCRHCKAIDSLSSSWPFVYCYWCNQGWCNTCAQKLQKKLTTWTPLPEEQQRRWAICLACVKYYKDHDHVDLTDPAAQQRAQKLVLDTKRQTIMELEQGAYTLPEIVESTTQVHHLPPAVASRTIPTSPSPATANEEQKTESAEAETQVHKKKKPKVRSSNSPLVSSAASSPTPPRSFTSLFNHLPVPLSTNQSIIETDVARLAAQFSRAGDSDDDEHSIGSSMSSSPVLAPCANRHQVILPVMSAEDAEDMVDSISDEFLRWQEAFEEWKTYDEEEEDEDETDEDQSEEEPEEEEDQDGGEKTEVEMMEEPPLAATVRSTRSSAGRGLIRNVARSRGSASPLSLSLVSPSASLQPEPSPILSTTSVASSSSSSYPLSYSPPPSHTDSDRSTPSPPSVPLPHSSTILLYAEASSTSNHLSERAARALKRTSTVMLRGIDELALTEDEVDKHEAAPMPQTSQLQPNSSPLLAEHGEAASSPSKKHKTAYV